MNSANWNDERYLENGFIEHQYKLKDMRFGRNIPRFNRKLNSGADSCCADNSCGVIAVYNTLKELGCPKPFPDLLRDIERKGAVMGGYFGVSPYEMIRCLRRNNLNAVSFKASRLSKDKLDLIQEEYDAFILFAYNDANNITNYLHHVCIVKRNNGFKILNAHDTRQYESLYSCVFEYNDGKGKPITVTAVKKAEIQ